MSELSLITLINNNHCIQVVPLSQLAYTYCQLLLSLSHMQGGKFGSYDVGAWYAFKRNKTTMHLYVM